MIGKLSPWLQLDSPDEKIARNSELVGTNIINRSLGLFICVALFGFVVFLFCFCFVLFCIVLYCFVLCCFVLFCFVLFCFVLFCFVLFCCVLFCFVLFCFLFCFVCWVVGGVSAF